MEIFLKGYSHHLEEVLNTRTADAEEDFGIFIYPFFRIGSLVQTKCMF